MSERPQTVSIAACNDTGPALAFGLGELRRALEARGHQVVTESGDWKIVLARRGDRASSRDHPAIAFGRDESYELSWRTADTAVILASEEAGLLYGCLDLAEHFDLGGEVSSVSPKSHSPELAVRGVYRFLHCEESEREWANDPAFWRQYADELARCRYNRFNLIYGHQSPYLVPIYAFMLEDLDDAFPEVCVQGITSEERARNLMVLQLASQAMASRGITFFLGIWNSRPWKIHNGVWESQPTRVSGTDDLALLVAYTRSGFTRVVERCPGVAGIQLRMNIESGVADQRFFADAFVPALTELRACGRPLFVELRNWGLQPDTVERFRSTGLPIVISTKFFAEHQAMPYPPPVMRGSYSYDSFLRKDKHFPLQWHVWNLGSHRLFNWGDPDYARRFVLSCHLGDGIGYEITPPGSQKGYGQWGQVGPGDWQPRADLPPRWDFQRYWFFHLAFGRMSYDVRTGDEVFLHQLALRTSIEAAPLMLAAYVAASQVISYIISQRMDDRNMYVWPEMDCGGPIDHNVIAPPGEETLFSSASEYAERLLQARGSAKLSPFDVARDLEAHANEIEAILDRLYQVGGLTHSLEYRTARVDFAALAALARYHAAKSRATGSLALFYVSGERRFLDAAEADAEAGIELWDEVCSRTQDYYDRLHLGPTGGHWRDNVPRVAYDLRRIQRVRELFDLYGLFTAGFDFGPRVCPQQPARSLTGLEPEPRFTNVDESRVITPEVGYGWQRTGGIRAAGFAQLPQDVLWGVHRVQPGIEYDPDTVQQVPLDGLTQRYLVASLARTFGLDLPNGQYEVTAIAPAVACLTTSLHFAGEALELGGPCAHQAQAHAVVEGGILEIELGREGPWALAGLVVRSRLPEIAHLPAVALQAEHDATITATATAPGGVRALRLRYRVGPEWRELAMAGDSVSFSTTIAARELSADLLDYEIVAEGADGVTGLRAFHVPVVRGFAAPQIATAHGPETWTRAEELTFLVHLASGEFARELRLHYREADQNRAFRTATQSGGCSGEYEFILDPKGLDDAYELLYYFEVVDVMGGGSFYPDPFRESRYCTCRPR